MPEVPPVAVEIPLLVALAGSAGVLDAAPVFFVVVSVVSEFSLPPVELPPPKGNEPSVCVGDESDSSLPPQVANGRTDTIMHEATQNLTTSSGAKSA